MDLKLQNSWDYHPDDSWAWSAYLTGRDLPNVQYVQYLLHPSFSKPVRVVDDPANGFRLESEGWGPFELKAIVHLKDGGQQLLSHEIKLKSKPERGRTDSSF